MLKAQRSDHETAQSPEQTCSRQTTLLQPDPDHPGSARVPLQGANPLQGATLDLWDQLFAPVLQPTRVQPMPGATPLPGATLAGGILAGCSPDDRQPSENLPAIQEPPLAQPLPGKDGNDSIYVLDVEVQAARESASAMSVLWERMTTLVQWMVKRTHNHHCHTSKEDLMQEAWIVFAQAVERYDGRSRDAFWTYLRLSLHTRFRQYAAHDRVIPIPHDTRQKRSSWHKITQQTFDARLQAQNLSYPDAENEGWSTIETDGENRMENTLIEQIDNRALTQKLQCLPRRWHDLISLSQSYSDEDLQFMLDVNQKHIEDTRNTILSVLRSLPNEAYVKGKTEAEYIAEWKSFTQTL